jgi:hypothetical protein
VIAEDQLVEPHHVARGLEALDAQALAHQGQRPLALGRAHLVERHAVTHQERMDVAPAPPHVALEREQRALPLRLAQGVDERAPCVGNLPGGRARLLELEEPGRDPAARGDAPERLGHERLTGLQIFL